MCLLALKDRADDNSIQFVQCRDDVDAMNVVDDFGAIVVGVFDSRSDVYTAALSRWQIVAPKFTDYLLAVKDVDAVIISTADFQHAPMLNMVAEAGKDTYCEKPMANVREEAKAARDAVQAHNLVVQIGTQHRGERYQIAAKEWIARGVVGHVSKVEIVWNYQGPRWRGRHEVKQIREEDTDRPKWLLGKPHRPFDPRLYFEFRLYREFSSGIADQWMVHAIDLVHYFLGGHFPQSVVAHGGVYAWRDGRENPDTFQALLEYPQGFLVSYATSFGNDSASSTRIRGDKGTLINIGGEGSQRWKLVEEKGTHESNPFLRRPEKYIKLSGDKPQVTSMPERMLTSRKEPNATADAGFANSVAAIMAARAQCEGKKLFWDAEREQILDHPVRS